MPPQNNQTHNIDIDHYLSDKYDPAKDSPTLFRTHWQRLVTEYEETQARLAKISEELKRQQQGCAVSATGGPNVNPFGSLETGGMIPSHSSAYRASETGLPADAERRVRVRELVVKIQGLRDRLKKEMNEIETLKGREKAANAKKGEGEGG